MKKSIYIGTRKEALLIFSLKTKILFSVCPKNSQAYKLSKTLKIPSIVFKKKNKKKIFNLIKKSRSNIVLSAGFPIKVPTELFNKKKIFINLHPSFLPKYKGYYAIRDAMKKKEKEIGCTLHMMSSEFDSGRIIYQDKIKIKNLNYNEICSLLFSFLEPSVLLKGLKKIKNVI